MLTFNSHRQMRAWVLAAVLGSAVAPIANAAVLVTNIDEPRRDATVIQQDPDLLADPQILQPWAAQSFTTDANGYVLQSIDLLLGDLIDSPTVVAELRSEDGGSVPGALLTTLSTDPISFGAPSLNTLRPGAEFQLDPSTTYWLVIGALGKGSYKFEYAQGNNQMGPGALGAYAYSDNQGATWTNYGFDHPYKLRVNVDPAQVDAPQVSAALGALALLALRRRRVLERRAA